MSLETIRERIFIKNVLMAASFCLLHSPFICNCAIVPEKLSMLMRPNGNLCKKSTYGLNTKYKSHSKPADINNVIVGGTFLEPVQENNLMIVCEMEDPIVEITDGEIRGIITKTHDGENIYAFLGIPYGQAPVGDLRFKAPVPVEPWTGIKEAVKDAEPCYQVDLVTKMVLGSEDCLYINVFTRYISDSQPLKPVLFYVHGGGFTMGSSYTHMFSPVFLMTEDIVFVSFNYRVGALGFLSLDDTSLDVPGNCGLKDQLLALKWVQKNIRKFGGDPNNVTMVGTSAGSISVNYHLLAPSSKGLFHKAILQSGTVLNPWAKTLDKQYVEVLKYLNIDSTNEAEDLEVLRSVSKVDLVKAQQEVHKNLLESSAPPFGPVIEKPNDSAFITRKPLDVIASGDYNQVPMLISFTSNEGLCVELKPEEAKRVHEGLYIPQLKLPDDKEKREELLEDLTELYNSEKYVENRYLAAGDSMLTTGILGFTKNLARTCTQPIYLYKFDVVAPRNKLRKVMKIPPNVPGASHGDDLGYIFESFLFRDNPIIPGTIEDITMRRNVKFWVNFAKYGNPSYDREDFKNLTWQPVTKDTLNYLYFGEELTVGVNPEEDRLRVWKKVFDSHEDTKGYIP